jgi:DNA-3-methyladenine glycosylase II
MNRDYSNKLDDKLFDQALTTLTSQDPDLAGVLEQIGPPPMWTREEGFATLVHIVLEQQVSLASAKAAFDRLNKAVSPLTAENFLKIDNPSLKKIGFSRQKTTYCRNIAQAVLDKSLPMGQFRDMTDEEAKAALMKISGIGQWTADIYLLMALKRPDIWPVGDLALHTALQQIKGLAIRPTNEEFVTFGASWKPWRAVAARILWHYYLTMN